MKATRSDGGTIQLSIGHEDQAIEHGKQSPNGKLRTGAQRYVNERRKDTEQNKETEGEATVGRKMNTPGQQKQK